MKQFWKYALAVAAVAIVSSSVSYGVARYQFKQAEHRGVLSSSYANDYGFLQNTSSMEASRAVGTAPDLIPAAESSVHAVVHIRVQGEQQVDQTMIDPFEFFFGGGGGFSRPQSRPTTSFGSGVIISTDGYILTNNHVVDGAKEMEVRLNDNRSFKAKLVGSDPNTDIALIKIDAKDLVTIPFGDSDKVQLGEWVLAVGNPFNLTSTVTAGIISAKAREAGAAGDKIGSFLQTDAAVNSGNSGGALVNAKGELIGINTMIYSQTGNYTGYSFAVPINTAAKVVADIKKFGVVQRAVIGVVGQDITPKAIEEFGLKVTEGALVMDFAEVSAAYAAGVEKGDVITHVNGKKILSMSQLQDQIGRFRPGDKITITVDRKGKRKNFTVILKNTEGNTSIIKNNAAHHALGAEFQPLNEKQMRRYGIRYGVVVSKVNEGKFKKVGIKPGFIILSINDVAVRKVQDVNKIIEATKRASRGRTTTLLIRGIGQDDTIRYYEVVM